MTWQGRAAEAVALAAHAGQPHADLRLMTLLLDPEDTAVSQAAAEHLLARGDATGLRLFVEAFGWAEEDTRNKLADCLYDAPDLWGRRGLVALSKDSSAAVSDGAAVLAGHMTAEEQTFHR